MALEGQAAEHGPSAGEYIVHHLTSWRNKELVGPVDFTVVNWDSMIFAVLIGVVGWRSRTRFGNFVKDQMVTILLFTFGLGIALPLIASARRKSSASARMASRWRISCFIATISSPSSADQ